MLKKARCNEFKKKIVSHMNSSVNMPLDDNRDRAVENASLGGKDPKIQQRDGSVEEIGIIM